MGESPIESEFEFDPPDEVGSDCPGLVDWPGFGVEPGQTSTELAFGAEGCSPKVGFEGPATTIPGPD